MFKLTYGLFVLTAKEGEKHNGCIVNTVMQVTETPNKVSVTVNKRNHTHDMIMRTGSFTASIISEDAKFELFRHFGFSSGRNTDKFADYAAARLTKNGTMAVLDGTNAYIAARVTDTVDLGTHTIFIAEVEEAETLSATPSATYAFYHANIKPKPEEKKEEASKKTVWRCTVCGYEEEAEELPDDFVCPLCNHGKDFFEKVAK